jgi:hypothetical protein
LVKDIVGFSDVVFEIEEGEAYFRIVVGHRYTMAG